LSGFLEGALIVDGQFFVAGFFGVEVADDHGEDELADDVDAGVEVEGGDEGFDGVGEESAFGAPAGKLFATTKEEMVTETKLDGDVVEVAGTDEVGFELGEATFGVGGVTADERFADEEAEDGVAKELELFVVVLAFGAVGRGFEGAGTVGERLLEQFPTAKLVVQSLFENCQRVVHSGGVGGRLTFSPCR
jgi:hypothetical protein